MKAKEYVAKYGDKLHAINLIDIEGSTPEERRKVCDDLESATGAIWEDFVNEFNQMIRARNIKGIAGLEALAKEFNQKWNAVNAEMVKKYGPGAECLRKDSFYENFKKGQVVR